jgi:drug/metabolite transporter (DMT)-like permease
MAALSSALFLGTTPVFGRQAILFGMPPLAVVAIRTLLAAGLLFGIMAIFQPKFLYIYPAGLVGCLLAGWTNGLGSLFYYSSLGRIDASVGQLIYALYPLFLVLWLLLDRQPPTRLTLMRIGLAIPAIYLLTQARGGQLDWIGVFQMLIASALYALHLPINQRVLYDMPAPTVTLYTLISMSAVVVPVYLFSGADLALLENSRAWWPVLGLTFVTFFSRLMLFMGVKHIGGMQTAILGLGELLVTLVFARFLLGESFSTAQWIGAIILVVSLMLVVLDKTPPRASVSGGWLSWLHHPGLGSDIPWHPHD